MAPVDMGWSDVGSWDALYDIAEKDADGNVYHGGVVAIDASGCLIRSDGPLVAVGVKDPIVIATGDAILIMPHGGSREVKRVVEALKKQVHATLGRPCPLTARRSLRKCGRS